MLLAKATYQMRAGNHTLQRLCTSNIPGGVFLKIGLLHLEVQPNNIHTHPSGRPISPPQAELTYQDPPLPLDGERQALHLCRDETHASNDWFTVQRSDVSISITLFYTHSTSGCCGIRCRFSKGRAWAFEPAEERERALPKGAPHHQQSCKLLSK